MKRKTWLIRLLVFDAAVVLVLVYLFAYFFPTVKDINRLKRQASDLALKMEDTRLERVQFSFPGQDEEACIARVEEELKRKIPGIKGKRGFTALQTRVIEYLQDLALEMGIAGLEIEPGAESQTPGKPGGPRCRLLLLEYSCELRKGLAFVNRVPWGKVHTSLHELTLGEGNPFPRFRVAVKIYYFSGKDFSPGSAGAEIAVDIDSELLLDPVTDHAPPKYKRKELLDRTRAGFLVGDGVKKSETPPGVPR